MDLHSNIKVVRAVGPAAVGTTGAANGTLSSAIDRKGYESVTFSLSRGVSASAVDVITPVVLEANATGDSFTSVADADLIGTEAGAALSGAAAAASKLGYKGSKRYVKLRLYGTGTATSIVSAEAILGHPRHAPAS